MPNDVEAQYRLGQTYLKLNEPRKAQIALEEALALSIEDREMRPQILDLMAESLYQQERYDRLYGFLQRAVESYGTTADYLRQGAYLQKMGDIDAAEAAYRKAAYFAKPGDVKPYLALAAFYDRINDPTKALQALRWAYYVNPQSPEVSDRLRDHGEVPGPTIAERPPQPETVE